MTSAGEEQCVSLPNEGKRRAPRNRTLLLSAEELPIYQQRLITPDYDVSLNDMFDKTIHADSFEVLDMLPGQSVDLLIADPPYNLQKTFNGYTFKKETNEGYEAWLDLWMAKLPRVLKPTASIYICGDWQSSSAIQRIGEKYFNVKNRITWEREKGRGALRNWKNCSEDIWFFTASENYFFDVDAVKMKRKVIAPYRDENKKPKDWYEENGMNFRVTHPSNLWTDISIPFWSMPENTDHPTQKPEKLIAKLIMSSSKPGDLVLDPFLGSGTSSVVAKKLGRHYIGIEQDLFYCCLAEKRLAIAEQEKEIQGYADGFFWERNSLSDQKKMKSKMDFYLTETQNLLFGEAL